MKKNLLFIFLLFCTSLFAQPRDVGITFEFANGDLVVENSQEYYAFDVMVYADQAGTHFGSGMIYLNYSVYSFGYNISSNENIIVEKGVLIEGELSPGIPLYEIVNVIDNSNRCVAITTGYNFPMIPDYGNLLPMSSIQYLHIKIAVQNVTGHSGLSFRQDLMHGQQYYSDDTTIYNPVIAIDVDNTDLPITPEQTSSVNKYLAITPNPFGSISPQTSLSLVAPESGTIVLNVFNIKGQRIARLYQQEHQKFDEITLSWDGKDEQHHDLSSGIYLFQLLVNNTSYEIEKVVIIR